MSELAGRCAVVTGGGRGIGLAVARDLAERGAQVVVTARTLSQVEEAAASIRREGHAADAVVCDVTQESSVHSMVRAATDIMGRIDILINNAGIGHSALVHQTTLDNWNRVMAVNATGAFLCTREVLPPMLERGWGRIVNVASVVGLSATRYIAAYAASKHALVGLTRAVAAEVAGTGVTCNAVCPSFVDTPMTADTIRNVATRTGRDTSMSLEMILATSGQSRLVTPEEVASRVVQFCMPSDAPENGEAWIIDADMLP
jgi:NAD(P)-dependent dehydrogenase (short-subunit alcohol dehydrogenase family)